MQPTNKPFVIKTDAPQSYLRCSNCSRLHKSPYCLNGKKSICEKCVAQYSLPEIGDRPHQVLCLMQQGHDNPAIEERLGITQNQRIHCRKILVRAGLIVRHSNGKTRRTVPWTDPNTGKKHLLSRREVEILDLAFDPQLACSYRFCAEIAERLGLNNKNISDTLYRLRKRGIFTPRRQERDRLWDAKVKDHVLLKKRNPKVLGRLRGARTAIAREYLNRKGIHMEKGQKGPTCAQILYQILQEHKSLSREELIARITQRGFAPASFSSAFRTLKYWGVVTESNRVVSLLKEVPLSEIKRPAPRTTPKKKTYATHR